MRFLPALIVLGLSLPAPAQAPQADEPVATLRTGTKLVIIDVVATDKSGKTVHGMRASDFALIEDGRPQAIKNFDEHTTVVRTAAPEHLEPGVYTNAMQSSNGPLNILLLDALDTKLEDQGRSRQELLAYLKAARPGSRYALFSMDTQLHLLQGFTDDLDALQQAVTRWKPQIPMLMPTDMDGGSRGMLASDGGTNVYSGRGGGGNTRILALQAQMRPEVALSALDAMARYLAGLPGRKNLIWFAGSFPPIAIMSDVAIANPTMMGFRVNPQELRDTIELMARSQVAIYPIYAPGLTPGSSADANSSMLVIASQTGGRTFINSNDIQTAVAESVENGSSYYTLAYTPTNPNWDGRVRTLQVRVRQAGLTLSYRRSYYADDPDSPPKTRTKTDATTAGYSPMHLALLHGTPEPAQVIFHARVLPAGMGDQPRVLPSNKPPSDKIKGPFRVYDIDAMVDPRGMVFLPQGNVAWHDTMEFISFLYDADGRLVNSVTERGNLNLTDSPDIWAQRGGLPMHLQISVPVKGEYTLRIAVHDQEGDRVGAVEFPIREVRSLQPAAPGK